MHVSKERGDIKRRDEKRKGVDTSFCTMVLQEKLDEGSF